jgi:5-methyltetrahydropteroyltriglutamate--homocysteine methyltransferase
MKASSERILTTHVGSLARPVGLLESMKAKADGEPYDPGLLEQQVRDAVADAVRGQAACGLDVVCDGEQGKVSFLTYVAERLDGFELSNGEPAQGPSWQLEIDAFPEYYRGYLEKYAHAAAPALRLVCTGPVRYSGHEAVRRDIANLRAALAGVQYEEAFLPATSPSGFGRNEFYASEAEYARAVAEALREEYVTIVEAGLLLQVDDPWLIELLAETPATTERGRRAAAQEHVELLNYALRGIPPERIRYHTCYGLNHGPRIHDVPLAEVVGPMLSVNAGAYSFEVANPRHQHEWRIWEDVELPDGKLLMPGFLSHATNFVEHPVGIADGIVTYAGLVGRERVIASADCGFSSRATFAPEVHPTVAWAKLEALAEGARLASEELWSK